VLELIKIVIFGANVLITPDPINIGYEAKEIIPSKPLKALNCSASFNVNVTELITSDTYPNFVKEAESKFREGCLMVELKSKNGSTAIFSRRSITWGSPKNVSVNLKANHVFDQSVKYESITITSCSELKNASITWYNHGKFSCNADKLNAKNK
jgi:hypothetical protein